MPSPCKLTFDIFTLKVVFESRDVGYLCANFCLLRPLFLSTLARCTLQTDVRQTPSCLTGITNTLLFCILITFKKCILYFARHSQSN